MCSRLTICSITWPSSSSCPAPGRFTSTRMSRSSGGAQPVPASRRRSSSKTRSPSPPICRCGSRPAPILPTSSRSKTSSARKASCISGSVTAAWCWGIQGHVPARNLHHQQRSGRDGPPRAVLHGASWTTRRMAYDDRRSGSNSRATAFRGGLCQAGMGVPPNGAARRAKDLRSWTSTTPKLSSSWAPMERIYERSLVDLAALRFFPGVVPGGSLPAAGLPWFMSIFGRDSILTSLQALPFVPEMAATTLRALAAWQGTTEDQFRDEEPGKILHEIRYGEMTAFTERPHSPYFGAADVTPLFIVLLDEQEGWTGGRGLVEELEMEAKAALLWIDDYGDRNGDGYVDYQRHMETGLENQCWKDSWNSILFADGSNSKLPRATAEIQGYVYDAKLRGARMARLFWNDAALADRLEREAEDLKRRFNRDYWIEERGHFALAIDGDGRKVDSLTSNIGHLLWSGIVDQEHAAECLEKLLSDRLYSGWGIRTMAEGEGAYNPIGYHIGTVWPHDNSIIALGLARYGYRKEAARVAMGILEAATFFHERLPEALAGFRRDMTRFPVEYPTACSPQAWATGAPLLLLRVVLGLEPVGEHLIVDPHLPEQIGWLQILDIPGRWGRTDAFARVREG